MRGGNLAVYCKHKVKIINFVMYRTYLCNNVGRVQRSAPSLGGGADLFAGEPRGRDRRPPLAAHSHQGAYIFRRF